MRGRIDIGKDRGEPLPLNCVSGRNKRERRNNHFARHAGCSGRNLQTKSGIAHGNDVFHFESLGKRVLEFLHTRTMVRKPATIKNFVKPRPQSIEIANVRTPDMQLLRKCGLATQYGQKLSRHGE